MSLKKTICEKHPCAPRIERHDGRHRTRCSVCYSEMLVRRYRKVRLSIRYRWTVAKSSAKSRGIYFSLSLDDFSRIIKQPCVYRLSDDSASATVGIDRKANTVGYTNENSVACCQLHNCIKSDVFTYEQMLDIVSRYKVPCGNRHAGRKSKWAK